MSGIMRYQSNSKRILAAKRRTETDLPPGLRASRYQQYRELPEPPPRKRDRSVTLPRVRWLERPHPWEGLE